MYISTLKMECFCVYHLVLGIGMSVYVYIAERHEFLLKKQN